MLHTHVFNRVFATVAAAAVVAVSAVALGASPSVSAPAEDCAEPYPVADLTDGQPVTGLTVQPVVGDAASKTTPAPFTGEVIGVLKDGIAPGLDMVMARLTSTEIDRVGGIWAGMSGSPVYAADGRLIGAVSYGLALGPSPVAGITPFEEMDDYSTSTVTATGRVKVSSKTASKIASSSDASSEQASGGFRQLPLIKTVTGVSQQRLEQAAGTRKWVKAGVRSAGSSASAAGPDADTVVAGGNLGAAISWGDITLGGVGTATSVCNAKVVGFGHPMLFAGKTSEALMPASALYIQEDPTLSPFKVANLGVPVGTITDDRLTGITGTFGNSPRAMTVTEDLTYGARTRVGSSKVSIKSWNADVTFDQQIANHDRVVDGTVPGSEAKTWVINGKDAQGDFFSLALRNRYVSEDDITWTSPWDVADQVWTLSSLKGVTLTSVEIDGTVRDDTSTYTLARIQYLRLGTWHTVSPKQPVRATPGHTAGLRAVLTMDDGSTRVTPKFRVMIPSSAAGQTGTLSVGGQDSDSGEFDDEYYPAGTLASVLDYYRKAPTNDQVSGYLTFDDEDRAIRVKSAAMNKVIDGSLDVPVRVAQ